MALWGARAATSRALGSEPMASRYSGKVSQPHLMPSCSAVPGMSSTPSMSCTSHSRLSGATGAKPTPQLPSTRVVTPCQLVGERVGSQVTWPS